jgi:hypothetical protein
MKTPILLENTSYTFSDYFELSVYIDDLLNYFGYSFRQENYPLHRATGTLDRLDDLIFRWHESLPYINLTIEAAKREFLIAPVLIEVARHTHAKIKMEFPLTVNEQLKGKLDYYLQADNNCLIIEDENLEKGFLQLAVELIALDQWSESSASILYGAVSTGRIWQFGILQRTTKCLTQDFNLFRVPADVEDLLRVLIAILKNP